MKKNRRRPSRAETSSYLVSLTGEAAVMADRAGMKRTAKKLIEAMQEAEDDRK